MQRITPNLEDTSMQMTEVKNTLSVLNRIMEVELAGVVRYTHFSLMIYGNNRLPMVEKIKGNTQENIFHAHKAWEFVSLLGNQISLSIGKLLETQKHDIADILRVSLDHEKAAVKDYYELLKLSEGGASVLLEEYAKEMIASEELHLDEMNELLGHSSNIEAFQPYIGTGHE